MTFGVLLRNSRKKTGLTQQELARLAGIAMNTVSRLETGKNLPSTTTIQTLSLALKMSVAELIARSL